MKTGRTIIISICLIMIMSVCQMLPVVTQAPEYFDSHGPATGLQLNTNLLHNSLPALDNGSARQTFQKVPVRRQESSIYRYDTLYVIRTDVVTPVQPSDIRSMIRETILQYFNGSKYKASHLKA